MKFDVKGYLTGFGNPTWKSTHKAAEKTAVVVTALLKSGATCVGKTVVDEFSFGISGENKYYGTPTNPRMPSCTPGGSSCGSAVAVAAGLVDFAVEQNMKGRKISNIGGQKQRTKMGSMKSLPLCRHSGQIAEEKEMIQRLKMQSQLEHSKFHAIMTSRRRIKNQGAEESKVKAKKKEGRILFIAVPFGAPNSQLNDVPCSSLSQSAWVYIETKSHELTCSHSLDLDLFSTDTVGCVRVPAALCGIFGFRPSHGAVSTIGVLPNAQSLDTIGLFACDPSILHRVGHVLLQLSSVETRRSRRIIFADDLFQLSTIPTQRTIHVIGKAIENMSGCKLLDL
ncbi:hypothetical protein V8G54_000810 [Vigna mungo]|uniref:Amidase domain-containing protein n=1 Tax=Vigna mungo TaxID=3915 RepID=A0AAQ3P754_VIGMU